MARKRKRDADQRSPLNPVKKAKISQNSPNDQPATQHPVLRLYYPSVLTLREYLLSQLPAASKSRRKKITAIGYPSATTTTNKADAEPWTSNLTALPKNETLEDREILVKILDTTLIGVPHQKRAQDEKLIHNDFVVYSQRLNSSANSSLGNAGFSLPEVTDFAISTLFRRIYASEKWPKHLLCHGYARANVQDNVNVSGLTLNYPNPHVATLKSKLWSDVHRLLGKEGDKVMLHLILECDVFVIVGEGKDNYYQLSGVPLSNLPTLAKLGAEPSKEIKKRKVKNPRPPKIETSAKVRTLSSIIFVRARMMDARAAINAKGDVHFGLRHIHVLNRYPRHDNLGHTVHLLKYIFPKQFGLHNVFTSSVDQNQTTQPFMDYTLREDEIAKYDRDLAARRPARVPDTTVGKHHLPKRLRGLVIQLAKKLQKLHSRCAYQELLKHYCPADCVDGAGRSRILESRSQLAIVNEKVDSLQSKEVNSTRSEASKEASKHLTDAATPSAKVSAFCRAVLGKLIPNETWGIGEEALGNKRIFMRHVDTFVHLRLYENISLHTISQNIKIRCIPWLAPPDIGLEAKISLSEMKKRTELLLEFVYYVFDSILIPLIRSNFHVTGSNENKSRLFFFRHDLWRALTEPALATIKLSRFEEMKTVQARKLLDSRRLGFSHIRLLPKRETVRTIINMKRRVTNTNRGKKILEKSINKVLEPVFTVLKYEKAKQPARLGSSLFSVGDIYAKLKTFRNRVQYSGEEDKTYYFAKVDVQSCFDTIPQQHIIDLMEELVSEDEYWLGGHMEIKPGDSHGCAPGSHVLATAKKKKVTKARASDDFSTFEENVNKSYAVGKKRTVFIDWVVQKEQDTGNLLKLLRQHIESNVVKISKKFYRQKQGIPQGSVLSSLLCNFFYGKFEQEHLGFLDDNSLLLRLIDDFMLITTKKADALQFLQIMHNGNEDYGITIKPQKSLVNFDVAINDIAVPQLQRTFAFPYCGTTIDTKTLDISKDRARRIATAMADSLTVELAKTPGKSFHSKAMKTLKIQNLAMYFDTSLNHRGTVLSTLYQDFVECAMKVYRYAKLMGPRKRPAVPLQIKTIQDLMNLGYVLIRGKQGDVKLPDYDCAVSRQQVQWLAAMAFSRTLRTKQSVYGPILAWLAGVLESCKPIDAVEAERLQRVARQGDRVFRGYKF